MKTLEKEFIRNVDSCGDHRFTQVDRSSDMALYIRRKLDGRIFGYECFKVKIVKAGTSLPGGAIVDEDYEVYPSKHAFGKTAMFISANKEIKTSTIVGLFNSRHNILDENDSIQPTYEFNIPNEEFTIKMLMAVNPSKSYIECYQFVNLQLGTSLKLLGTKSSPSGKGKPSNYYTKNL